MAYKPTPIKTEGGRKKAVVSDESVEQLLTKILVELGKVNTQLALITDNVVTGDELD